MNYVAYNYTLRENCIIPFANPHKGEYGEAFDNFMNYYDPYIFASHPDKKPKLTKKSERMCRFCIKDAPSVKFKKDAHVIPQLMSNRNLLHDCECDSCNSLFGKYEDSFSKYLGMMRTTDAVRGQEGIPTFKSADGKLSMRHEKDSDGREFITINDSREVVEKHKEGDSITINVVKQPYIPLHVMKTLYKIGYSLLPHSELLHFQSQRAIIVSSEYDHLLKNFARVGKFTFPFVMDHPKVIMFRKSPEHAKVNIPSIIVTLYFHRYMYQFFLIDMRDEFLFKNGEQCKFFYTPPFCDPDERIFVENIDLSDTGKRKGEIQSGTFTFF